MTVTPVLRFAPSPNGELHLGHALSALTGFDMARRLGGRFLLRIEDIDVGRTREAYVAGIFEDLTWLGITWEEPVLRQSQHFEVYRAAAGRLADMGLLYPCFATRAELTARLAANPAAVDPDGAPLMSRSEQKQSVTPSTSDVPHALRLDMTRALAVFQQRYPGETLAFTENDARGQARRVTAHPERWGDVVIVRKDVPTSYHLAVVVDDARQGVTHVTRGMDLFAATDIHRLLQALLDLPEPLYHHHRLLTDDTGRKLAKSAGDKSLRSLRAAGVSARDVREMIGLA
jgi:glutamyl-Q tRNA(Asp) synthetase